MEKMNLYASQEYKGKILKTVAIYSRNREEWIFTDIACWMANIANVPLYDALGEESISWIMEQTQFSTVFMSSEGIPKLIEMMKKGELKTLKNIISFDQVNEEICAKAKEVGFTILYFQDLIKIGKENSEIVLNNCCPDDIMTICYTSGTTNKPKGAVITHRAFRDNAFCISRCKFVRDLRVGQTFLSYLPLAHVFERVIFYYVIIFPLRSAFFHGVVSELVDDLQAAKPDILIGVPRIFCRFHDSIINNFNSLTGFKKKLVQNALSTKIYNYEQSGINYHWLYDRIVFKKIRESFGGKIHTLISAAAPIDPSIMVSLKVLLCCDFVQGYGQTETSGAISVSYYDDMCSGCVGPPLSCSVAKVVDVPEMNYFSTDTIDGVRIPRGELCLKGSFLAIEYFKDEEKSKELYDSEGWMHTGDIALIRPSGCIKIIDRKKNIFKLQHGEYISPEKIENVLLNSPWVAQMLVCGNSYQDYIVGILIPQKDAVMRWATAANIAGTYEELCNNSLLNKTILKDLEIIGKERKLLGFEILKKIYLTPNQFTIENGTLTPTLKIKRNEARMMYSSIIDNLYSESLP